MSYRVEAVGAVPLGQLGKGPRRDPPPWARSAPLLLGQVTGMMRSFYAAAGPDEIWRPVLIAVCANGEVANMMVGDEFHRDAWASMMRGVLREAGVVRYVQTMESWMSFPAVDIPQGARPGDPALDRVLDTAPRPEDDPERREVAIAFAVERGAKGETVVLELLRGADGRVSEVRDMTAILSGPAGRSLDAFGPLTRLI